MTAGTGVRPVQVKCLVFAHQRFDGALLVSQRQSGYRSAWHFHDLIARNLGRDKDSPNFPFFPLLVFTIAKSYPFATCHDTTIIRTFTRANTEKFCTTILAFGTGRAISKWDSESCSRRQQQRRDQPSRGSGFWVFMAKTVL